MPLILTRTSPLCNLPFLSATLPPTILPIQMDCPGWSPLIIVNPIPEAVFLSVTVKTSLQLSLRVLLTDLVGVQIAILASLRPHCYSVVIFIL